MKKVKRDVETDAMVTILNTWRDGNSSKEFKLDAFEMLRKWVGPEKCMRAMNRINSLIRDCKQNKLADDYIDTSMNKVYAMLDYLCNCDDPELEYAGRYARKRIFASMGAYI